MSQLIAPPRRLFLSRSSQITLSAAAVGLLAGSGAAHAQSSTSMAADVGILNVALGLEHEAINAYQLGAMSGLLQKAVLDVAVAFQSHHKAHRDALIATIQKMGGMPVAEKKMDDYAKALNAGALKNQADVLMLATRLELGATNAYLGVIPAFRDNKLGQVAARLAADETMHYTALMGALGQSLPNGALSFGA
ncbi:ferritin-like domain-containing protein [Aquincola sp. S2]|uniref:Ferritin-like domain-containing protein n=1 Tax=Pseudaquabacterium terrae TaxID=2732868 RepID=A0ABX2EEH8_9BURK|nr:ferritin-like domain-containing protein [Aquabacterium terrae]NRF67017.1 ferritin-like domain-containing protein [Aquabacterium terrae]